MTIYRVGSNQYKKRAKSPVFGKADKIIATGLVIYTTLLALKATSVYATGLAVDQWLSSHTYLAPQAVTIEVEVSSGGLVEKNLTVDEMVDKYSKKYGKTRYEQNRLKALTHYLLLKEQNYGGSNACGDSGRACGPMQFHEGTYYQYRQQMVKKGLATVFGSRLDMENAIDTAIYMLSIGQEKQWGPVFRGEINI